MKAEPETTLICPAPGGCAASAGVAATNINMKIGAHPGTFVISAPVIKERLAPFTKVTISRRNCFPRHRDRRDVPIVLLSVDPDAVIHGRSPTARRFLLCGQNYTVATGDRRGQKLGNRCSD
jgi:hypothetical protein